MLFLLICLGSVKTFAQKKSRSYIKDQQTGCRIVDENNSPEVSITWTGGCKNNLAEGWPIAEPQDCIQWITRVTK
ncbi:hypothetical protein [Pedobacter sp. NJ-S-72]